MRGNKHGFEDDNPGAKSVGGRQQAAHLYPVPSEQWLSSRACKISIFCSEYLARYENCQLKLQVKCCILHFQNVILGFCASLCNRFCLSFVALNKFDKKRLKVPRNGKRYFNFVAKFLSFDLENKVNDTWKFLFLLAVKYGSDRIRKLASFLL